MGHVAHELLSKVIAVVQLLNFLMLAFCKGLDLGEEMLEIQLVRLFFEKRLIFEQRGIIDLSQLCQDELTQESSDRYENKGKAENSKKKNSNRGKTKKVIKKNPN